MNRPQHNIREVKRPHPCAVACRPEVSPLLFGALPIPGLTCPSFPLVTPVLSPTPAGVGIPSPTTFPAALGAPVATPFAFPTGVPLPVPTAPFVVPFVSPFPAVAGGFTAPFPAAPVLSPFGIPFAPTVPSVFGVPFC